MYTPAHFLVNDPARIAALIRAHSFGVLVTTGAEGLQASHLPFLFDPAAGPHGTLSAHLARANGQWREFNGAEVLVIFQGEHGYISPTWFATQPAVPTWNYESVHAYGVPRIVPEGPDATAILDATVRHYERADSAYALDALPAGYVEKMSRAIVAFEIPLARVEAKSKLSQNRSREDVIGVVRALEAAGNAESSRLAAAMRREHGL